MRSDGMACRSATCCSQRARPVRQPPSQRIVYVVQRASCAEGIVSAHLIHVAGMLARAHRFRPSRPPTPGRAGRCRVQTLCHSRVFTWYVYVPEVSVSLLVSSVSVGRDGFAVRSALSSFT